MRGEDLTCTEGGSSDVAASAGLTCTESGSKGVRCRPDFYRGIISGMAAEKL